MAARGWRAALLGAAMALAVGCGKSGSPTVASAGNADQGGATEAADAGPKEQPKTDADPTPPAAAAPDLKAAMSFEQAVLTDLDAGADLLPPPDRTLNGLATGKLHDQVAQLWPQIKFANDEGKPQTYHLVFDLAAGGDDAGQVEVHLRPDLAPNHVRNFVALAMSGYYNGLRVDRVINQEAQTEDGKPAGKLTLLEAGAPTEAADPESAHLGYWLRPEFSEQLKHEPGTVGACLHQRADTAACRFYVTLTPAPAMDGNFTVFGQVVRGLDVLQRVAQLPVQNPESYPERERFAKPVVIKKVTVLMVDVENPPAAGDNK